MTFIKTVLIDHLLSVFNSNCAISCTDGQTGSGKTHTMMGYDGDLGLVPRLNNDLFVSLKEKLDRVNHTTDPTGNGQTKCLITVSKFALPVQSWMIRRDVIREYRVNCRCSCSDKDLT